MKLRSSSSSKPNNPSPSTSRSPPPEQFSGGQKIRPQRLFTEEDETHLLKIFYKVTKSSPPSSSPINSPNLDRIERSLGLRFSHTQIIDKLRRLRLKYHKQARTKSLIKTHHDRQVYKIARKIWGKTTSSSSSARSESKGKEVKSSESGGGGEEVGLEEFPVLKKEVEVCCGGYLEGNVVWKKGLMGLEEKTLKGLNEKWMLLKLEEAKVMAWRAELVKELMELIVDAHFPSRTTG
ncbi:hypothetical protein FNV43_RR05603 [Rhamnella rubrinervis]|uniref:Glabrous enhancer-binding protein-like DBD domain-containing protein n=1 Tax=Rhamnella rubrinervis TaxID=2594499 RepID=A0A8K0HMG3_9ROSA|nr:hypothetical protein FNV43_RR05603 [Rhamnella rubrinervis]